MESNKDTNLLGLDGSSNFERDEYNLVNALMQASNFKEDGEKKLIEIRRDNKVLFSFTIRPLSEEEVDKCYEKATSYTANPAGRKYPPIPKKTNKSLQNSYMIYTATIDEDKNKIWDNPDFKSAKGIVQGVESVDLLLKAGEKERVLEEISGISGFSEEIKLDDEEAIKN